MVTLTGLRANEDTVRNSSTSPRSMELTIGPLQIAAG